MTGVRRIVEGKYAKPLRLGGGVPEMSRFLALFRLNDTIVKNKIIVQLPLF